MLNDLLASVNGITINYRDSGEDKIPFLLIHPFPFNQDAWLPQLDFFKDKARVITYDLRGFGKSTGDGRVPDMDLFADDLVQLMNKLAIDQAIVAGLSLGGYILLNAVERYPERFRAIILCDTQCLADSKENKKKRYESIDEIHDKGLDAFAQAFVEKTLTEETFGKNKLLVEKTKEMILSNSMEGIAGAVTAMAERRESCSRLRDLSVPALILCGREDVLTPLSLSEFLFTNIPGAKMHTIDKAGHLSNLEQPDVFNQYVEDFIASLDESKKRSI